jgi:hypothetical protein
MTERTADMAAFDTLPRKVRAAVRDLPVSVSAVCVAESVRQFGLGATLAALADIASNPPPVAPDAAGHP